MACDLSAGHVVKARGITHRAQAPRLRKNLAVCAQAQNSRARRDSVNRFRQEAMFLTATNGTVVVWSDGETFDYDWDQ